MMYQMYSPLQQTLNVSLKNKTSISIVILTGFLLSFSIKTKAQVAFIAGGSYCNVRNNEILENQDPIVGYHYGPSITLYPFKKFQNIAIQYELLFSRKGYQQNLDKNYTFHFDYISLPLLINFTPSNFFSIQAGAEFSKLCNTNVTHWKETYNNYDIGLIFGFTCFTHKRINIYSRVSCGLMPMLDYYTIDQLGNFADEIHDLKNICLSVGIKFNLYNEKIYFFK